MHTRIRYIPLVQATMPWSKDHCVSLSRLLSKHSELVSILPSSVQQVLTTCCRVTKCHLYPVTVTAVT